jgi:hypothetical protein
MGGLGKVRCTNAPVQCLLPNSLNGITSQEHLLGTRSQVQLFGLLHKRSIQTEVCPCPGLASRVLATISSSAGIEVAWGSQG